MQFESDPTKSKRNKTKRGFDFSEAEAVFLDPYSMDRHDAAHSQTEERHMRVGLIESIGIVAVVYTDRPGDIRRIISARKADRQERRIYYEQ